ncbi:MAG: amino acid ABC transporter permease [Bacteroidetes bacterium]|nr:MAG: amino acid ABC transporter permease [Bacteroidota bacterium]
MAQNQPKPGSSKKKPPSDGLRYAAMGFQMAAIIGLGTWLGIWLDGKMQNKFPGFTLGLMILSLIAALWYFIRDALKKK